MISFTQTSNSDPLGCNNQWPNPNDGLDCLQNMAPGSSKTLSLQSRGSFNLFA